MKYKSFSFLSAAALMVASGTAVQAQTFTPLLSATVGTGSTESFLTLDFQDGAADHNYAFGYKYNGAKTGADFLAALSADTSVGILYAPGYTPTSGNSAGVFVNSFSFNGHSEDTSGNSYWAYFTGSNGQNWTYSGTGASGRTLSNDSWDGWSWDADYNNPTTPTPVTPAAAPVPEASTTVSFALLLAFGMGGAAFSRKKARV